MKLFKTQPLQPWWEDQEKWRKFCERVTGIEVIFKNTFNNSDNSIGIIEGAIIKHFPSSKHPRPPMPVLIINFPNTSYKEFSLENISPTNKQLQSALKELE